ncbi:MAG: carbohydrate binding family 9 domain-containing protein [Gemmatimonadetes bacterium]|nr:carbohydrate binding family 9 domain-containing protein [Gemmatimonadota bacterium]
MHHGTVRSTTLALGTLAAALAAAAPVAAQATPPSAGCWVAEPAPSSPAARAGRARAALGRRVAQAARVTGDAPVIDGRLDEAAWCAASAITDLVQSGPAPGALADPPTVARILFDEDAVYVGVRLYDPRPDSIVAPYPRRDDETTSDWVFFEVDSRFDRRTGYSFGVNPRGVQVDGSWSDDVTYDPAWNGVWDAAASEDARGWTAELRIPYSQLPMAHGRPGEPLVWGINIYRYVPHRGQSSNWSPRLPSVVGVISHFNELRGLVVPSGRRGLEATPYTALTATSAPDAEGARGVRRELSPAAGLNARLRTATAELALSIHPDFGQVEADPSQVNLTTFETFLPEQRPLFVEGADVFRFGSTLAFSSRGTSFEQESPFYSRRIGRAPTGRCAPGTFDCRLPTATTVLGAMRLSGHTASGWTGGVFHAWTGAERATAVDSAGAPRATMLEPLTHYTVARAERASVDGRAALGVMATFTGRVGMKDGVDSALARRALVVGADGRARFGGGRYELTGFALASRVDGAPAMIDALRREPRHGYGRPARVGEPPAAGDSSHTSLAGLAAQARVARVAGDLRWGVAGRVVSQGFEANDLGFQRNADWILAAADWTYQRYRPGKLVRRWSVGSRQLGVGWTFAGERRAAVADLTASADLRNYWGASLSLDREFAVRDPEVLRGGPALLLPPRDEWTATVHSDTRRGWQLSVTAAGAREPATRSAEASLTPTLSAFVTDHLQLGLTPMIGSVHAAWQFVARPVDAAGRPHALLGDLHQTTTSLTARGTYALSAHLTLQLYAEAFLSAGRYDRFGEVVAPLAARAEDRVAWIAPARLRRLPERREVVVDAGSPAEITFADPAFSERDAHVNLLLRWEFRPGSTIFLVWTQQRLDQRVAAFDVARDLSRLGHAPSTNALLLKVSYWLSG